VKYFFIHHYHNTGELDLQYCPTDQMWADVLTKPLQGIKFRLMWAFLMNCPIDYSDSSDPLSSSKPRLTMTYSTKSSSSSPCYISLDEPTDAPMKDQFLWTNPSLWGCVETPSLDTTISFHASTPSMKSMTWRDKLFLVLYSIISY
jgi:hypothetical protein